MNISLKTFSVRRPITIYMLFSIFLLWGVISFFRIPIELRPNTNFTNISIILNVRGGMAPEEVEKLITIPIEDVMSKTPELRSIRSTSKEGRSTVVLSFMPGTDMDIASFDISDRFEKIKNALPSEAERPVIAKYDQNDLPVMIIALSSDDFSEEDLRQNALIDIKPNLQRIKGVANVEITGGREKKIVVEVDEEKLVARGLSIDSVTRAISRNNLNILAGDIQERKKVLLIRTQAVFKDLESIKSAIIQSRGNMDIIRVKDIADVSYQYMDRKSFARINGRSIVSLYIQKESEANTVNVCSKIEKKVESLRGDLSAKISLSIIDNQARFINEVITKVESALIMGGVLAVLVLFFFLRDLLATFIIGISIPVSVIITIGFMYFSGISINIMSLSGLALGIGMLVDNSIVVLENISKKLQVTENRIKAIVEGTAEVFWALVASTTSTLVVFLPLVFVNPQTKIMYGGMSLTITFALVSSLFVSVTLVPAIFSLGKGKIVRTEVSLQSLIKRYQTILVDALRYRYFIMGGVMILFLASMMYLAVMEKDIFVGTDESKFIIFIELQSGAKLLVSDKVVKNVENVLRDIKEVKEFSSRVEGWSSKIYVKLNKNIFKTTKDVIKDVREKITGIGEMEKAFIYTSSGKNVGATELVINIFGESYENLLEISSSISKKIKEVGGFFDFKLRYKPGRPEMGLKINKTRAALLGFSVKEISDNIHAKIRGVRATKIFQDGKEIEAIIRLKEKRRKTLEDIRTLTLVNKYGIEVSLSELVDFNEGIAPSEIWHKDKMRMIQVSASTLKFTEVEAMELIGRELKSIKLPKNYFFQFGGDYKELKKTFKNLQIAGIVMLLLVFMLLASLLESYLQPLIIMVSVPLAIIGVSLSLIISDSKMTMGVLMGMIMLGGIVVNNAIVLIDKFNNLKRKKISDGHAIIMAGKNRLRPILMTTITTILGLLPLTFDNSSASSLWKPLGITVIGGLASSAILTLIVLPVIFIIVNDFNNIFNYRRSL